MDFFAHQQRARRTTLRLVALFALAILCFVGVLYGATVVFLHFLGAWAAAGYWWDPALLAVVAATTLAVLGGAAWHKTSALAAQGGAAVATLVGGRPLHHLAATPAERTLLNVVAEMAVAASLPVPWVYVLDDEPGINAFTAGYAPDAAVVVVTGGALHALSRDELQGVMAHEFSHILSGDMRLNTRLLGLLGGLLLLARVGHWLMQASALRGGDEEGGPGCTVAGTLLAFLIVVGMFAYVAGNGLLLWLSIALLTLPMVGGVLVLVAGIGALFSRLIQQAVSRQREFLADAAAVQFTRYPEGLAGALQKIAQHTLGARILSPAASLTSHFFFAAPAPPSYLTRWLDSHPPLAERMRRLEAWPRPTAPEAPSTLRGTLDADRVLQQIAAPTAYHLDYGHALLERLPEALYTAAHDPAGAQAVVFGLLLHTDEAVLRKQLDALDAGATPDALEHLRDLLPLLKGLSASTRLPLIEILIPALRRLPAAQKARFREMLSALATADRHVSLFEFALYLLLQHWLPADPARQDKVSIHDLRILLPDCCLLLSALAHLDQPTAKDARRAFEVGRLYLPETTPPLMLTPREQLHYRDLEGALARLGDASMAVRRQAVDACAHGVLADGTVSVKEAEMLRVVAVLLNCPLPPFLPAVA